MEKRESCLLQGLGTQGPSWLWLQNHGWCLFAWWLVWDYDGWTGLAFWIMRGFARLLASLEKCSLPLLWVFVIYFLKEKYNKVVRYILSQLCNTSLSIMPNKEKWVKAFGFTLNLALLSTLFIKISGSEK